MLRAYQGASENFVLLAQIRRPHAQRDVAEAKELSLSATYSKE